MPRRLPGRVVKVAATAITFSRLTADDFAHHFTDKIDRIRASTAASPSPVITDRLIAEPLSYLRCTSAAEVTAILNKSSAKQCQLDPVPTWLVKRASDIFAPIISGMCNASLEQSKLPVCCKRAIVRPLLKNQSLDPNDPSSYRPISNLSFMSKMVEKVVDARISEHVAKHNVYPSNNQLTVLTTQRKRPSSACAAKRLQLNASKTEVMWFGTAAGLRKLPVGSGNLGVWIDSELTMRDHISRTCHSCFYHRADGKDDDHFNSVLAGLLASTLAPLHAACERPEDVRSRDIDAGGSSLAACQAACRL